MGCELHKNAFGGRRARTRRQSYNSPPNLLAVIKGGRGRKGREGEGRVSRRGESRERGVRTRLGYLSRGPGVPSYATGSSRLSCDPVAPTR